jgi:hypothetical protein
LHRLSIFVLLARHLSVGDVVNRKKEDTMKYFVLIAGQNTGDVPWDQQTPEQQGAEMAKHGEFAEACSARPGVEILGGEALGDGSMATTLRTSGTEMTVTDGPYAEAAEQIGGFYLIEAPDLDTIIDLCRILPYVMDIRPVLDIG